MVLSSSTFISDTVKQIRDMLAAGITDPISSTRPSTSRFVMTSYPRRAAVYPIITVTCPEIGTGRHTGQSSEGMIQPLRVEIRVWSRNVKERDQLFEQIYHYLRTNQLDTNSTSEFGLHDFTPVSAVQVSEEGEGGIHSWILEVDYFAVLT